MIAPKELEERALNDNCIRNRKDVVNILVLNAQNLTHHIEDVKYHHAPMDQNLIILSKTRIPTADDIADQRYSIPNYEAKFCNSGNGKGFVE